MALTLRALLREYVIEVGLGSLVAALARPAEALGVFIFDIVVSVFSSLVACESSLAAAGGY